jgi:hypothetical protein
LKETPASNIVLDRAQGESIGVRITVTSVGPEKGRIWRSGEMREGVRIVAIMNNARYRPGK